MSLRAFTSARSRNKGKKVRPVFCSRYLSEKRAVMPTSDRRKILMVKIILLDRKALKAHHFDFFTEFLHVRVDELLHANIRILYKLLQE